MTALEDWYSRGDLSRAHYDALVQWRDDGGGIRKRDRKPRQDRHTAEKPERDVMQDAARARHRQAWQAVQRLGDNVARSVHRLVLLDDQGQRVDLVARGAVAIWCHYFAR